MAYICENCGGTFYNPKTKGENFFGCLWFLVFFILIIIGFFCGVVPGILILILYVLIGCLSKQKKVCPHCNNENGLIPLETPKGQELYKKYNKKSDD